MASVTMKNVCKIYPNDGYEIKGVSDFNLEIKDGEVIVLVGPSGCGKTSTLFMLAGLEEISQGEVYFDGRLINDVHPKDRSVALVFHNFALFPYMTAFENIAFGLRPTDMSEYEIKGRVYEVAKVLDIVHLLDRKPKELSGGQKQRVALGRALVRKNGVVCLDEPLSNLDAKLRASMRVELLKLHKKFDTTFVYVTHDQAEAMTIADRIVVMKDGFIQQVGTPEELYYHPANIFVAGFIGAPQMNFGNVKVIEQNGDIFLDLGEIKLKLPENKADKASAYIGKDIIAGIRPEYIYALGTDDIGGFSEPHLEIIDAEVQVKEFLGDRTYLYCESAGVPLTCAVTAMSDFTVKSGDKIKLGINRNKIHLFDKTTELAID